MQNTAKSIILDKIYMKYNLLMIDQNLFQVIDLNQDTVLNSDYLIQYSAQK